MKKISDILAQQDRTFSMEFFPPKTDKGRDNLYENTAALSVLEPDYISVTYGAGGSTSKTTKEIINELYRKFGWACMHHLTLVNQRKEILAEIIREIKADDICNILALRGDPTEEMAGEFQKVEGGVEFCHELIDLIREIGGDYFSIGVAGFPEVHPDCPSPELDAEYLKMKIDHGADFVVTQYFFRNEAYAEYLERTRKVGVNVKIVPGVLPITDYDRLLRFSALCGANVPDEIHETFAPLKDNREETIKKGTELAIKQCEGLLALGAPGIHFYTLNKAEPVTTIWNHLMAASPRPQAEQG